MRGKVCALGVLVAAGCAAEPAKVSFEDRQQILSGVFDNSPPHVRSGFSGWYAPPPPVARPEPEEDEDDVAEEVLGSLFELGLRALCRSRCK